MFSLVARFTVGLITSGVALLFFIKLTPNDLFVTFLAQAHIIWIVFLFLIPIYFIRAAKLFVILRAYKINFYRLTGAQFAGIALNNLLPFRLGDVLRTAYVNQSLGIKLPLAILSLIIERLLDIFSILILLIGFLLCFHLEILLEIFYSYLAVAYALILSFFILICTAFLIKNLRSWFVRNIKFFFIEWPMSAKDTLIVIILALLQWVLEIPILGFFISLLVFGSPQSVAVLSTFFSNLSTLVPSAPGYIGTFEAAGILPFTALGFSEMVLAGTFILTLHSAIWIFSTVLGCLSFIFLPQSFEIYRSWRG